MPGVADRGPLDHLAYGNAPNSYDFAIYSSTVKATPVEDSAGRTTKWVDFDIEVKKALIYPPNAGQTTDAQMLLLRRILNKTGQTLTFTHKGYGDLIVNAPGSPVRDANFGPHVKLLDWQPSGNDQSCFVSWQCKASIPQCADARFTNAIAEMCYTVEHSMDGDGYATVTTTGHIIIPMTRSGDTTIPDHVDRYRERIQTQVPLGFKRINPGKFTFNEAKTRLDFTWTDQTIRTPLPAGVTDIKLTHKISGGGPAFAIWKNSIGGTVSMPPNLPKSLAQDAFFAFVQDRLTTAQNAASQREAATAAAVAQAAAIAGIPIPVPQAIFNRRLRGLSVAVIPRLYSVSNDPWAHGVNFQYDYDVFLRRNVVTDIAAMGLWRGFPRASFSTWRATMDNWGVTRVRGPDNLAWLPSDEAIIDLCVGTVRPPANAGNGNGGGGPLAVAARAQGAGNNGDYPPGGNPSMIRAPTGGIVQAFPLAAGLIPANVNNASDIDPVTGQFSLAQSLPNPEASWIMYQNILIYREPRGRYARHRPLAGKVSDPRTLVDAAGDAADLGKIRNFDLATAFKDTPDILQEIDAPFGVVVLKGMAERLGAPTPLPNLLTCRGCLALRNRVIESIPNWQVGRMGDIPLIRTTWEIEFLLTTPPHKLPMLVDPILGVDGGDPRGG